MPGTPDIRTLQKTIDDKRANDIEVKENINIFAGGLVTRDMLLATYRSLKGKAAPDNIKTSTLFAEIGEALEAKEVADAKAAKAAEKAEGGSAEAKAPAAPKNTAEFIAAIQARNAEAGIEMTDEEVDAIGTNAEKKAYLEDDGNFKKEPTE